MLSVPDRKLTALACYYELPSGGTKEVHTESLGGKTWPIDVLYNMFKGCAESAAQEKQGIQTFEMRAFFDGKNSPEKWHQFSVIDGEIRTSGANRTIAEHPTAQGHLAQMMRHVEHLVTTNTQLVQTMAATWMSERHQRNEEETAMRREVNDAYGIVREMMMQRSADEHAQRMRELEFQRTSQERQIMIEAAPTLVNALAGKDVIPQDKSDSMFIDAIAEKVGPEQIQILVQSGMLPPEMAGPLTARLAQAREKKRKEAEELKKLPEGETGNVTSIVTRKKTSNDGGGGASAG
jgi:hypothetical protein